MTKIEWLTAFCNALTDLQSVKYASYLTKSMLAAEKVTPYISVVTINETSQAQDAYSERYLTNLSLYIVTREQDDSIEVIVEDIKELIPTLTLADNVHQINYTGTQVIAIEDYNDVDGSKYSSTRVDIQVIWSKSFGTATNAFKASHGLTEPLATAHYKMYALLSSGSYSSMPLGVKVYDTQFQVAIDIPAGSGSLLVGAQYDTPIPQAVYSSSTIDNHLIGLSVDVVTGYVGQNPDLHMTMRLVDDVIYKIRTNWNLGGAYKGPDNTNTLSVPQICAVIPDSNCVGARINLVVNCWKEYEQE